jgi:hypothetical protein
VQREKARFYQVILVNVPNLGNNPGNGRQNRPFRAVILPINSGGVVLEAARCIECNRWSWRGSNRLFMELPEEDLAALRGVKRSS